MTRFTVETITDPTVPVTYTKSNKRRRTSRQLSRIEIVESPEVFVQSCVSSPSAESTFIGSGTSGDVFTYSPPDSSTVYAKKVFRDKKSMKHESDVMKHISAADYVPKNIIKHYPEHDDSVSMVYELGSESLEARIKQTSSADKKWNLMQKVRSDISAALDELTMLGVVHKDIKPGNIFFHDGRWKLGDFGSAIVGTKCESFSGFTPLFMSPHAFEQQYFDNNSDRWALGVTLWMILHGLKRNPMVHNEIENQFQIIGACSKSMIVISDAIKKSISESPYYSTHGFTEMFTEIFS